MEYEVVSYFSLNEKSRIDFLDFLQTIEWKAKNSLARKIQNGFFSGFQDLYILKNKEDFIGFIALVKEDEGLILDGPFLAYLYIAPPFRNQEYPKILVDYVHQKAVRLGFHQSYILSDHKGYYERFGYEKIRKMENGDSLFVLRF